MIRFGGCLLSSIMTSVLLMGPSSNSIAQSSLPHKDETGAAHKITFGIGHVYFTENESEAKNIVLSAYALNYDYVINKHWCIGSHNDILIENESMYEGTITLKGIVTQRPVITKVVGLYSPFKDSHLMFGFGDEFSRSGNHFIINMGLDYGIHITEDLEIAGEISYDSKIHGVDNWIMGIGICRTIRRHHKVGR